MSDIKNRKANKVSKPQQIQDRFLNELRKSKGNVAIYLVNGIKLQGRIRSFDQYVVVLENTTTQMVYKHAISTVVPGKPIDLDGLDEVTDGLLGEEV